MNVAAMTKLRIYQPADPSGFGIVDALPCGVPGLMIHKALDADGWMITHARSGIGVAWFPDADPEAVLAAAQEIGPLTDWTASGDTVVASGIGRRMSAICRKWGSRDYPAPGPGSAAGLDGAP